MRLHTGQVMTKIGRRALLLGPGLASSVLAGVPAMAGDVRRQPSRTGAPQTDAALFVREWGQGRPVVFTHSLGLSSDMWNSQVLHLSDAGFRCITYDRRGHGRSAVPGGGYDMDTLADDLASVILRASPRAAVALVGHSMGAGEILRYLARHGTSRVSKIVLLAPTTPFLKAAPGNPHGLPESAVRELHDAWARDFPAWVEANQGPFFTPSTSPAMIDWLTRLMLQTPLPVVLACNQAMIDADHRAVLPRIDKPVLVLHGEKDVSAPLRLTGRPTAEGIPNAQLRIYPDAPHGLFVTHARQVNAVLASFLGPV